MKLRVSRKTEGDIYRLTLDGLQNYGLARVDAYVKGLRQEFRHLAETPFMARERQEYQPPVRFWTYNAHVIVYAVEGGEVVIRRVLHHRQDIPRRL